MLAWEIKAFPWLVYGWIGIAVVTSVVLLFVTAPYGRHNRAGWGPTIPRRAGWILQELPAALVVPLFFWLGDRHANSAAITYLALWQIHYMHRVFVYPFRLSGGELRMPLMIVLSAVGFNLINGYIQGRALFSIAPVAAISWHVDPRFICGFFGFITGMIINISSDSLILRQRRKAIKDGQHYVIPQGGLFRWVSCANYFGEIIEWCSWAVMTWSLAGLSFAIWTAANLVPRAIAHHRWYHRKFPDYPKNRKAVFPFIL